MYDHLISYQYDSQTVYSTIDGSSAKAFKGIYKKYTFSIKSN